jgi:amidohydrolase
MKIATKHLQLLEQTRKQLHSQPELSGKEFNTQQKIIDFLESYCNIKPVKVANTGVLAEFKGKIKGKKILIRGDIDALPIQEINEFNHKSTVSGISHKCGHDGHTTIALGLALLLSEKPLDSGTVYILFQPSEENGKGAQKVLNDSYFKSLQINYAFALHNLPGFPLHEIVIKDKEFTSNVKSVIIKLKGKTSHAAEPEKGYNPANTIARIIQYSDERTNNNPNSKDFFLITPVHINMGKLSYGISAGYGEVHLTIRSWSTDLMETECKKLEEYVETISTTEYINPEIIWLEEFYANVNNTEAVSFINSASKENNFSIHELTTPFKWGEDFGLFTQQFKGAIFGLGAGKNTPALHNPDYDFPDEITPTGINLFYTIIQKALNS